jgi:hypothetical protein
MRRPDAARARAAQGGGPPRGGGDLRRAPSAPWSGAPWNRPATDAEETWRQERWTPLRRLGLLLLVGVSGALLWMPSLALSGAAWLELWWGGAIPLRSAWSRLYPWLRDGVVLLGVVALIDLVRSWWSLDQQIARRQAHAWETLVVEPVDGVAHTPLAMVDVWHAFAPLLDGARLPAGAEPHLVVGIEGGDDGRAQLIIRTPRGAAPGRPTPWTHLVHQELEGRFPGLGVRFPDAGDPWRGDRLHAALAQGAACSGVLAWADRVVRRGDGAPLRDLLQFDGDPMGPGARAVERRPGVIYAGYEVLVRGGDDRRWRAGVRRYAAHVQLRQPVDAVTSHPALMRYAESPVFDVVVRCLCVAQDRATAHATVCRMTAVLDQFARRTRGRLQGWMPPPIDRVGGRHGVHVLALSPTTPDGDGTGRGDGWALLGGLVGGIVAVGGGWASGASGDGIVGVLPPAIVSGSVGALLGWGAGRLLADALLPVRRRRRMQQRMRLIAAHAHRPRWCGWGWPIAPHRMRSWVSAYDLATLWHPPEATLSVLIAFRSTPSLPRPEDAFLSPEEAHAALTGAALPPPTTPADLGRRRIGLALAERPDGGVHLIGPSVFDLRKGMECLGPMGSGKSSFLEVVVQELARVGAGCVVIDAKGDLADRLVGIIPPDAQERVLLVDLAADRVPCLNPIDRRFRDEGVSIPQIVGQVEQLFARMNPETWPESAGMQQFARMGLRAILEGEPTPTLLHLDRFYASGRYRTQVLQRVANPGVREFWQVEYPAMDPRLRVSLDSFRRRLQHFITDPVVQHLFCQPVSTIYLPDVMDARRIVIIKLVPEVLSEALARIIATALFASLRVAAFTRQHRHPDPMARWDCPLIIDEVQKFIDADHPNDAETFFTQTRSLGVGIIGAHQGLYQYSEAVRAAAIQSLGSLVILGPVKDDAALLCDAYAETGLTEAHFAAVRAQRELLIRFPVHDRDCGLMSARPRVRPAATVLPLHAQRPLVAAARAAAAARRPPPPPHDAGVDQLLQTLTAHAHQVGVFSAADQLVQTMLRQHGAQAWLTLLARLEQRRQAIQQADQRVLDQEIADPGTRIRERSIGTYGVDPLISALRTQTLARLYPAEPDPPPRRGGSAAAGGWGGGRPPGGWGSPGWGDAPGDAAAPWEVGTVAPWFAGSAAGAAPPTAHPPASGAAPPTAHPPASGAAPPTAHPPASGAAPPTAHPPASGAAPPSPGSPPPWPLPPPSPGSPPPWPLPPPSPGSPPAAPGRAEGDVQPAHEGGAADWCGLPLHR